MRLQALESFNRCCCGAGLDSSRARALLVPAECLVAVYTAYEALLLPKQLSCMNYLSGLLSVDL